MLLEIAMGDAYGAGFEFAELDIVQQHNDLMNYRQHFLQMPAGSYTDDTQMSIAIAEAMLAPTDWDSETVAQAFVTSFKRDQRLGYAKGFHALLCECETGADLLARIRPDSRRNGAAMRAVPLGLLRDEADMVRRSDLQANITHATEEGRLSSLAVAYMARYFFRRLGSMAELGPYLEQKTGRQWQADWSAIVECDAIQTVNAVYTVLLQHNSLSNLLKASVAFGGDVDSVAAIALGVAALGQHHTADLPFWLHRDLEQGPYGYAYLKQLDAALLAKFSGAAQ